MKSQLAVVNRPRAMYRGGDAVSELVGAFESDTVAVFHKTAPVSEHVTLYVLVAMVLVSLLLMSVVKLDKVVVSVGRIVPIAGALYISPFDTAIVKEVRVKAGEIVRKGQVLATLDPTFTHADLIQLQQKMQSLDAAVSRLQAELAGRPYVFAEGDSYQLLQGGLWQKRQNEYHSNLADFDARIHSTEAQVTQYESDATLYEGRLKIAGNVENLYKPLLEKGYVSRLQAMQATDERTEIGRLLSDAQNQMRSLRQTLASLKAQRESYIQKWHSDIGTELVTDTDELDLTRQNLEKAKRLSDLSTLNAPADAVVLNVGKVSSGSVAQGGGQSSGMNQGPLFTLVPLDAAVEADVHVSTQDIGFIKKGDAVQVKLDAYRFTQHGAAEGTIKSISEGSFTEDDNNVPVDPYFKVRVAVTGAHLRNVPTDFRLVPGMTLTGDIMVGRRTILSYLVDGAFGTLSESLREP